MLTSCVSSGARSRCERDPKPPAPAVHRDDRAGAAGAPLWRLVDFVDGVAPAERAAVEAALEGAGVLDAWVRPDGVVLDGRFDAVLGRREHGRVVEPVQGGAGRTLRELLRPDEAPPGCGVAAETVVALLGQIGLDGPAPDLTVAVARDGRWWAGDLAGRTTKSAAQYIGTGAREAERARRLAGFDQQLAEIAGQVGRVEAAQAVAQTQLHAWTAFVDAVPDGESLLQSWRALDVATTLLARARTADDAEQQTARTARSRAAELLTQLQQLASTHGLPVDQDGLGTRRAQVEDVAQRLSVHRSTAVAVTTALARWSADDERANREADEAELREHERATAHARHEQEARRLQELSERWATTSSSSGAGSRAWCPRRSASRRRWRRWRPPTRRRSTTSAASSPSTRPRSSRLATRWHRCGARADGWPRWCGSRASWARRRSLGTTSTNRLFARWPTR